MSLESDFEIVGIAENGKEAIAQVEELEPDIVLMDVRMPVMNGSNATKVLSQKFPLVKVLILSTYDDDYDVNEAIKAGAKGYLLKDMPSDELVNAIRNTYRGYTQFAPGILESFVSQKTAEPPKNLDPNQENKSNKSELNILTPREAEVAELIVEGTTNQEIAKKLYISESTVKTHLNSIFNKLNLKNRAQLASYLCKLRLTS